MATNFEFYKDEILKITSENAMVAVKDGIPVHCGKVRVCSQCDLVSSCEKNRFEWLYAEHIEPPKLTKRERAFCEAAQTGWISRDYSGNLAWRDNKPKKVQEINDKYWIGNGNVVWLHPLFKKDDFGFIRWSDEKPWAVEDLLQLEVKE